MWLRSAVLAVMTLPLLAEEPTTRLRVDVRTLGGKPIERASVILDFVEGRSAVKLGKKNLKHWEIRTNQDGIAKLPEIPQGKVRIQVIAKGYQTYGETYEVLEEEKTIEVRLNPPQPQYSAH